MNPAAEDDPAAHLAAVFAVDAAGGDVFLGQCPAQAFDRIYGGQLAAQALLAAARTVPGGLLPISSYVNFLKIGTAHQPVTYRVERAAEGRSLATRVVHAAQGERLLSVSIVAFQDPSSEHGRIDHAPNLAPAPPPESRPGREVSMRERFGDGITTTMGMASWPVETRYIDRLPWSDGPAEPTNRLWMRSRVALPGDPLRQRAALLYAGDLHLFEPVLFPGSLSWHELVNRAGVFGASLDYAMWFHRPFRFDEWLLHEQEAPAVANSRGLTTGRFWTSGGELVASVSEQVGVFEAPRL